MGRAISRNISLIIIAGAVKVISRNERGKTICASSSWQSSFARGGLFIIQNVTSNLFMSFLMHTLKAIATGIYDEQSHFRKIWILCNPCHRRLMIALFPVLLDLIFSRLFFISNQPFSYLRPVVKIS